MLFTAFLILMLVLAVVTLFVNFSGFLGFLITRVPYVRTYKSDIEFIVKKLQISSSDVFYDLGSGDGRVVFLVNKLTGAKCVGFELTWWTYLLAQMKSKFYNPSQSPLMQRGEAADSRGASSPFSKEEVRRGSNGVQFRNQNFFKHSWSEATIIYGYLYPPLMARVEEKFLADCKPGSVAIIRDFPFPNLKPQEVFFVPKKHEVYIYQAPFPNMRQKCNS